MKCLKNQKTGAMIRIDDNQATQLVGNTWKYINKTEYKAAERLVLEQLTQKQIEQEQKKEETKSEKAVRHAKLKTKQRPAETIDNLIK